MGTPACPAPPDAEGPPTLVRTGKGVATLTLRRPSRRNSLDDADLHALLGHFDEVQADLDVRVLVLSARTASQGRSVFCAGYQLGAFDDGLQGPGLFEQVADALARLRPVTVCALGGSVYGGATDLALACDLRVALAGCEWRMPAAALGLHFYPGGLRRYVSRLGLDLSKRAFLTGQPLAVETLASAHLFDTLAPTPEAFDAALGALTSRLMQMAPLALQATKQSLNDIAAGTARDDELRAREAQCLHSSDFAEGRAAFAARRPPTFTGR